jgi:hypothetical protein
MLVNSKQLCSKSHLSQEDGAGSRAMTPEVKVELARRVPCSVAYNQIGRDREVR